MSDPEDTRPYAPAGPSLLEEEAGPPEATRLDGTVPVLSRRSAPEATRVEAGPPPAAPDATQLSGIADNKGVEATRIQAAPPEFATASSEATQVQAQGVGAADERITAPQEAARLPSEASGSTEVTRVYGAAVAPPSLFPAEATRLDGQVPELEDTPLSGPPGALTEVGPAPLSDDGGALEEAGPTQAQAFGRPSAVAVQGLKPYPIAPPGLQPVARSGLRVRESVRPPAPVESPLPAALVPVVKAGTPPPGARPWAQEELRSIGVDPAVFPVTYQPTRSNRPFLWMAIGIVGLVLLVGLWVSPAENVAVTAAKARTARASALAAELLPATNLGSSVARSSPVAEVTLRPPGARPPRPKPKAPGRPRRGLRPPPSFSWMSQAQAPTLSSEPRDYDTAASAPSASPNVYVYTDPPGALVEVDGQLWGASPLSKPAELEQRQVKVRVFLDGYLEQTKTLEPNELGHFEAFWKLEKDPRAGQALPGPPAAAPERRVR